MCRLVSGEIIISGIIEEESTDDKIVMDTPMVVIFQPAANGQLGINLFPLNPFTTSKNEYISIKADHIMFWLENLNEEIQKQYVEITTGITMSPKKDIETPHLELVQ